MYSHKGTVNSSVLRAAEVFRAAVIRNCPSVIVAHNHPSGDPTPSPHSGGFMRWLKRGKWKAAIALIGLLFFLVLMVWVPLSARAYAGASRIVMSGPPSAKPTVDVTATMTALQKEQLILQNKQLQQSNDRGFGAWLWSNAAAIVASLLSTLVVVSGALVGFWQWRMNRSDIRTKESNDRKEAQDKDLRAHAEERFKAAITALGSENEATQVGVAILLRSFLNKKDEDIYGRYYTQIFDLAAAYLRFENKLQPLEDPDTSLTISTLRQALIVVFKESYPLARSQNKGMPQSLDARNVQLDGAYFFKADLGKIWMPFAYLREANLNRVNLRGALLQRAILKRARLVEADLEESNLAGSDLQGADLSTY